MNLAVVVQRYGADINGGAELHARYIAERLARHARVEVLTSCARDYVSWANELAAGPTEVNGVAVHRFPVSRERDVLLFARRSDRVFDQPHSVEDELAWLDSEGPASPALIDAIRDRRDAVDFLLFFSYRYYHAYHGARAAAGRAVLVPTAERDAVIGMEIFGPVFRGVRAVMYNSHEERAMIQAASGNGTVPGLVVGIGSEIPAEADPERFRRTHGIDEPFALYVGRIDQNKGCEELFTFFLEYVRTTPSRLSLLLIGKEILPIPESPRIRHLGFMTDRDKFDALAAADMLIMPSYLESLSMVALEAWGLGRPVVANAKCDVLHGQCIRSNAGLYYENFAEFAEALFALERSRRLRAALGANGRAFYRQHYAWPVIERKYLEMLEGLKRAPSTAAMEPLPGWFARRRRRLAPASEVMKRLPTGPVLDKSSRHL